MYNRYIPQPDGSYRRNKIPDRTEVPPQQPLPPPPQPQETCCEQEKPQPRPPQIPPHKPPKPPADNSALGFLKQLLPKGFDTGDLLIVLLILLMAGSCEEEQNTALLTLALYLFM